VFRLSADLNVCRYRVRRPNQCQATSCDKRGSLVTCCRLSSLSLRLGADCCRVTSVRRKSRGRTTCLNTYLRPELSKRDLPTIRRRSLVALNFLLDRPLANLHNYFRWVVRPGLVGAFSFVRAACCAPLGNQVQTVGGFRQLQARREKTGGRANYQANSIPKPKISAPTFDSSSATTSMIL